MLLSFHRSIFLTATYLFFYLLSNSQLEARWGLEEEAGIERHSHTTYKVDRNGRWTKTEEIQLKILNEAGRESLSALTVNYDATRRKLEILEAKTSNNNKDFIVPKQKIEDKPLASDVLGLRNTRQILIPFQQVVVGSILYLKCKEELLETDIDKYFDQSVSFGEGHLWKDSTTIFRSELPLFLRSMIQKES